MTDSPKERWKCSYYLSYYLWKFLFPLVWLSLYWLNWYLLLFVCLVMLFNKIYYNQDWWKNIFLKVINDEISVLDLMISVNKWIVQLFGYLFCFWWKILKPYLRVQNSWIYNLRGRVHHYYVLWLWFPFIKVGEDKLVLWI